jgi:hypothetical protein
MKLSKFITLSLTSLLVWNISACIQPALAKPVIEINSETEAFDNKTISDGKIKVTVSYKPINWETDNPESYNLFYQIDYDNQPQVKEQDLTVYFGEVFLQDLDNNKTPEVVIATFSGGAHCCNNFIIYSWQNGEFSRTETGMLDGGGGKFEDLDGDGTIEFITNDNNFLYTFSSYAGSFPPTQIFTFRNGKLENVTRNYPDILRQTATEMYQVIMENKDSNINGVMASYVAQKALLGELEEAWQFMLENYNSDFQEGLTIYENGEEVGTYPDYPTALKALLVKLGYWQD